MAKANSTAERIRLRMRFSLRLLLLVVTAFAIAFPIWYRWPHEEVEYGYPSKVISPVISQPDKSKPPIWKSVKTFQRSWGSLQLQHVKEVYEQFDSESRIEISYSAGVRHGPYVESRVGRPYCNGQYLNGKRHGEWRTYEHGAVYIAHWKQDRLDGVFEIKPSKGQGNRI